VELRVPPLRERVEDIAVLARHFLREFAAPGEPPELTADALTALRAHPWPGNIRELENQMQRAVLVCRGREIDRDVLDLAPAPEERNLTESAPANELEPADLGQRDRIEAALLSAGGVVSRAASDLGLSRQALYRQMSRLGIVMERKPRT